MTCRAKRVSEVEVIGVGAMSDTVAKPVSEAVRRLEILTGAGRRRTWSAARRYSTRHRFFSSAPSSPRSMRTTAGAESVRGPVAGPLIRDLLHRW